MPRLFIEPGRLGGEQVLIEGEEHRHLVKVLRLQVGDDLVLFDGAGTEIDARLVAVGSRTAELVLGARRQVQTGGVPLTLLQALPRGDRMDFIVQKATELGVTRVVPVLAGRTQVRPPPGRHERWQTIAREAARQSGRADVPTVEPPLTLLEALGHVAEASQARFILFEGERTTALRRVLTGTERAVALLIGPEGGFGRDEVHAAQAQGFVAVGIGPRILRVETAAVVAMTLVQAAVGALD